MQEGGTAFFYTTDHLGNIRELTDSTGAVRARYEYDPYGRATKLTGDKESVFTYAGLVSHSPSGLLLANYRAYDPAFGRWISPDPIGLAGGVNLYAYVGGQPTDSTDPLGLLDPAGYTGVGRALVTVAPVVAASGAGPAVAAGVAAVAALAVVVVAVTAVTGPVPPDAQPHPQPAPPPTEPTTTTTTTTATAGPPSPPTSNCPTGCKPCIPPVGTRAYRVDTDPSSRWHRGIAPPHWQMYEMHQAPLDSPEPCKCFWKKLKREFGPGEAPPSGEPPIAPAAGGGPA
jgi:RHS repeat-associated protein